MHDPGLWLSLWCTSLHAHSRNLHPDLWDVDTEPCEQTRFNDLTGVDSLSAPIVGLIVFVAVQFLERNGPLIKFDKDGVMAPYLKDGQGEEYSEEVVEGAVDKKEDVKEVEE